MIRLLGHSGVGSRTFQRIQSNHACRVFSSTPLGTPYSKLTVGIPKENYPLEKRVAATPESVKRLVKPGFSVLVEDGAGDLAYFSNADYEAAGAQILEGPDAVWGSADLLLKVKEPISSEYGYFRDDLVLFTYLRLAADRPLTERLVADTFLRFKGLERPIIVVVEPGDDKAKRQYETRMHIAMTRAMTAVVVIASEEAVAGDPRLAALRGDTQTADA